MPEFRQNVATKDWVIVATERAKRPEDFVAKKGKKERLPFREDCPFCPGNETKTPPSLYQVQNGKGWQVRVIPNKFAALVPDGEFKRIEGIPFHSMTGIGDHEVIIETPKHNLSPALLEPQDMKSLLAVYRDRYKKIISNPPRTQMIIMFRNHGESAGTSLEHPHSQVVATPIIPLHIKYRIDEALRYYESTGECVFCYMIDEEMKCGDRIIAKNDRFVVFEPFASSSPFETWIMPLHHSSSFDQITDDELSALTTIFQDTLKRLYHGLDDPDYNYMIKSSPVDRRTSDYFHWYIKIVPRLTKAAGFEIGSGMYINSAMPEKCAEFLRNVNFSK